MPNTLLLGRPSKTQLPMYLSIDIGGENLKLTVSPCIGFKPQKNVSPMYARSRL